jgi:hypothetical protein
VEVFNAGYKFLFGFAPELIDQRSVQITLKHYGVDVTPPTDRRSIAEHARNCLDSLQKVSLCLGLGGEFLKLLQRSGCEDGSCPGPKILDSKIRTRNLT